MDTQVLRLKKKLLAEIKREMKVSNVSQGEVGRRVEMLRNNVNSVLLGRSNASLDQLVKIASSIDLTIELAVKRKTEN